jgi:arginyl-tRNA synthetase
MELAIKSFILNNASSIFGQEISETLVQFQKTRKDVEGDLTMVIFPFVKILSCSPADAGNKIGNALISAFPEIKKTEVVSGFLNITLADSYWLNQVNSIQVNEKMGLLKDGSLPLVMVEYASPNTNKPLHLGHLRNIFLGDAVASILKAAGHKVVRTQIINDRGIHICKSMLAWEKFSPINAKGERETPLNSGLKGDKLVGKYYVEFDKHLNSQAKDIIGQWEQNDFSFTDEILKAEVIKLQSSRNGKDEKALEGINAKIKEFAKNQTDLMKEAKDMLVKWEARDPQTYLLWSTMNGWVYDGFEKTYQTMGVHFDKLYYESDTYLLGKDVILEGLNKGVFFKKDDGSVWIDLTDEGLDEKLVLRSDGTAVYITQDIGTALDRFKDFPDLSRVIYTVGNEQDYHFKVLFLILKKMGYSWAEACSHLSYGMVDLPTGKMKSREGTVVDADDLMAEVIEKATEMTKERGHLEGMNDEEKNQLYRTIGLGGLKYYLLKVDPKKRMLFNPEESIELNGNTGPFIQYAHARIQSLLLKSGMNLDHEVSISCELCQEEIEIVKLLSAFPDTIAEAAKTLSPAVIANYCFELVKVYNHFYQSVYILNETNEDLKYMRLVLSKEVGLVIKKGMQLLGINVPNRM